MVHGLDLLLHLIEKLLELSLPFVAGTRTIIHGRSRDKRDGMDWFGALEFEITQELQERRNLLVHLGRVPDNDGEA